VLSLAHAVVRVAAEIGFPVELQHVENPRVEKEVHYYSSVNKHLLALGLEPTLLDDATISGMIRTAARHSKRVDLKQIPATVKWADATAPRSPVFPATAVRRS
jgi:UDP-sulfoquinovose synthase